MPRMFRYLAHSRHGDASPLFYRQSMVCRFEKDSGRSLKFSTLDVDFEIQCLRVQID
jgi:hypothetical protein